MKANVSTHEVFMSKYDTTSITRILEIAWTTYVHAMIIQGVRVAADKISLRKLCVGTFKLMEEQHIPKSKLLPVVLKRAESALADLLNKKKKKKKKKKKDKKDKK